MKHSGDQTQWASPTALCFDAGGHRLRAEWRGPVAGDAPTLVFLHEGLGSIAQWKDVPARLGAATGCGVLVYDRWGYGGSEALPPPHARPVDFMQREGLTTVPELLDAAGLERVALVGHSDGATIALMAASTGDARIRAVVSIAAHLFAEDAGLASIARVRRAWGGADLRARLAKYHGDNVDGAFLGWANVWLDPAFRAFNIEPDMAGVTCPVLAIQGTADEYGGPAQIEAISRAVAGPVETLVAAGVGHAPHFEAWPVVGDAITRFLAAALND